MNWILDKQTVNLRNDQDVLLTDWNALCCSGMEWDTLGWTGELLCWDEVELDSLGDLVVALAIKAVVSQVGALLLLNKYITATQWG